MANKIDILVVEPGVAPHPAQVEDTLEAFQQIVGGPIEAGCYLPQRVMLICNSEGKHMKPHADERFVYCHGPEQISIIRL